MARKMGFSAGSTKLIQKRERLIPKKENNNHPFLGLFAKKGRDTLVMKGYHKSFRLNGKPIRANKPISSLPKPYSVSQIASVEPTKGIGTALAMPIKKMIIYGKNELVLMFFLIT